MGNIMIKRLNAIKIIYMGHNEFEILNKKIKNGSSIITSTGNFSKVLNCIPTEDIGDLMYRNAYLSNKSVIKFIEEDTEIWN